eukprot:m.463419 g.463419  ORF g.463419 m.463419 type:complete len:224 (-) comp23026_c0_seq1:68-739(-)
MAVASWQTDSVESGNIVGDGAAFSPTSLAAWRVAQETLDPDERETVDPADVWAAAASPPLSPEPSESVEAVDWGGIENFHELDERQDRQRHSATSVQSVRSAQEILESDQDPGVWLYKEAETFGRKHRRWFVLHRDTREFAYYEHAFIPPRTAKRKGAINLNNITGVSSSETKLEISVAKGRRMFRLYAETEIDAGNWACILKMVTERMLPSNSPDLGSGIQS